MHLYLDKMMNPKWLKKRNFEHYIVNISYILEIFDNLTVSSPFL